MIQQILQLLITIILAFLAGKLVSRLKLPSILGWLIAGMILGPHALSIMGQSLLDASWYQTMVHILECAVGLMIGTELVWNKLKRSGKSIVITTLTQSLGTFLIVSLVFGITFYIAGVPLYLAFIFGGIALATAPAPALSIVREFQTNGPVTKTLIPMAALDDIVGCVVFFTTIAIVAGNLSAGHLPAYMIALVVILPLVIGAAVGVPAGFLLKKQRSAPATLAILIGMILVVSCVGFFFNSYVMPSPVLNFMLIGMAFSAAFANIVSETRLEQIMQSFNPFLGIAMIIVILNLGAPLDYHLILGAGLFTAIYIISRAFGKYFGAYFGASVTGSPETVKKYLGFTLLPHSGVSLVFTGIAVSALTPSAPDCAKIIQGTIAAAAVINEIIAVIAAKKGFEWAGELTSSTPSEIPVKLPQAQNPTIITISRQYGSGGREIGKRLAEQLSIPFYDHEIIERAAQSSAIDKTVLEDVENNGTGSLIYDLVSEIHNDLSLNDKIFLHQAEVIRELASRGPCVIVGRCADYVLRDRSNLLKVFICADLKNRQERITNIYHDNTGTPEKIEKADRRKTAYYNRCTNQKFGDVQNYDICLNSSSVGISECIDIILSAYNNQIGQCSAN